MQLSRSDSNVEVQEKNQLEGTGCVKILKSRMH